MKPIIARKFAIGLTIGLLAVVSILFGVSGALAQSEDELLTPEEAFAFSSELVGNTLIARWDIAQGYYMYQDKFVAESQTDGVQIGELIMSPGKPKIDQFFGEVVIYEDYAEVQIPLTAQIQTTGLSLDIWGQGCNEPIGICYPPTKNTVSNPLAIISAAAAQDMSAQEPRH